MPDATAAQRVQLLCLDVDGVMTDGSISINDEGVETKRFHVRDGTGLRIWLSQGLHVAIVTGRRGMAVQHRAKELGISHVIQGSSDKRADVERLLGTLKLTPAETAMLGDDLPDLPLMQWVGYPMAVADAVAEVRAAATYITHKPGGHGAVRDAIEHLLRARKRWDEARTIFG